MADTKLKTVFGWWDWDAETPALVNRVTGERVAFRGRFQDPDLVSSDETWLRFDYLHPKLNFPLLVFEKLADLSRDGFRAVWTADYEKSVALWRLETQTSAVVPPYGAWRRIDDCLTDALACWPETECASEPLSGSVVFRGGWLNGDWATEWRRIYDRLPDSRFIHPTPTEPDVWLQPLGEGPLSRWVFHPVEPQIQNGGIGCLEAQVLLEGLLIEGKGTQRRLILPADVPLTTLEGKTAYLLTDDGTRLLYPMTGETDPTRNIGHSSPQFRLIYVDEDIVCELFARPIGNSGGLAHWYISSAPASLGYRSARAPEIIGTTEWIASTPFSRRFWLRVQWAMFDAWSHWRGTAARSPKWVDGLDLRGADAVTIRAGYRGGQLIGNLNSTIGKLKLQAGR